MAHTRKDSFGEGPWERAEERLGVQANRTWSFSNNGDNNNSNNNHHHQHQQQ